MREIRWDYYPRVACIEPARRWVELLVKLQKAPKTVDAYARGLDDFIGVCERADLSLIEATRGEIATYIDDLTHRVNPKAPALVYAQSGVGLSNATLQQRLTVVRLWYDYLIEMEVRINQTNPVGRGAYTRQSGFNGTHERGILSRHEQQPWIPGDNEWDAFLTVVLREECVRNRAMVYLAYDGALRRGELLALRVSDIDWPHNMVTIRPEVAKNGRGRVIFYSEATQDLLVAYLRHRTGILSRFGGEAAGPMFVSESHRNSGHPLSPTMWNKIVQGIGRRAALPHFKTHTFRHLRLTDLARCRLELYEIALFAGHKNVQTTELYINLSGVELGDRVRTATQHIAERMRRKVLDAGDSHGTSNA